MHHMYDKPCENPIPMTNIRFKILGSSYILGANPDQLTKIYEVESRGLEPWQDSPGEISIDDWREFLGKRKSVVANFYVVMKASGSDDLVATSVRSSTSSRTNSWPLDTTGKSF